MEQRFAASCAVVTFFDSGSGIRVRKTANIMFFRAEGTFSQIKIICENVQVQTAQQSPGGRESGMQVKYLSGRERQWHASGPGPAGRIERRVSMGIHLYDYNQKAYAAAVTMMEEEGRAAVIHPTGTGKSFIAFKLAEEHSDCRVCWLAPSEYIFTTQLENLKRTVPDSETVSLPNIRFLSYSRLMRNEESMKELRPDYIVLDEFHRCGAAEWGKSVGKLLELYPRAKVLGLSATNIRYLDGQRDMAQEIFRGNIASEMTLGEAVAQGILSAPKYVVALYRYQHQTITGCKVSNRQEYSHKEVLNRQERSHKEAPNQQELNHKEASNQQELNRKEVPNQHELNHKEAPNQHEPGHKEISNQQNHNHQQDPEQRNKHRGETLRNGSGSRSASYDDELQKLEQRVESLPDGEDAAADRRLLEQLKRALEQVEGLDQVFKRHMRKRDGKYLVFCAGREHMEEMKAYVGEWFRLVDAAPHVYTAYYNSPETSREFAAFKEDKGKHLKLLFCIDMLNEGVHVEDVDGVILLRPTVSPIIYLQQVGRALSAGSTEEPVIFDLVNNFEGLRCIDCLEQELTEAFMQKACINEEKGILKENYFGRFHIIDEARDCRILFRQLQNSLTYSWETYYLAAGEFYREKGNLRIPKSYVTSKGLNLGSWLQTQRKVYAGKLPGNLTKEKQAKLEAIGMEWSLKDSSWEKGYEELTTYHKKYGNLDIQARYVTDSGYALGKWVCNLRAAVKKKGLSQVLSEEQQQQLEALGMIWDKKSERWETYLSAAREYRQVHGNLKVPVKYITEEGLPLGNWLHTLRKGVTGQKDQKGTITLTQEQLEQLNELGMEWEKESIRLWNLKFGLAREYYEKNGNLDIPVAYCVEGVKLGRWIANIRAKRKNPGSSGMVLDEDRIRQLDSIGMEWK